MCRLHKRFTSEQVKVLLQGYCRGTIDRASVEETLGIGKTRFFALLKEYRQIPKAFSPFYKRTTPAKLSAAVEAEGDRKGKAHDREVLTASIGALVQHDASLRLWSPYAKEKLVLDPDRGWTSITSIDDFSRKLLYADFCEQETTWAHIKAAETLMHTYGIPLRYYVDSLRVFRFVRSLPPTRSGGRDSVWRKHVLQTDDVDTQWIQVMSVLGVDVTYALSPQAKGKIERSYRWLQDRIVRTCALEKLSTIEEVRPVLKEEVNRYNNHQVHSTTGEIPGIRFEKARNEGNSLFRPFALPKPYTSTKDVFCLREKRMVNGYRKISLSNQEIEVPNVLLREEIEVHLLPDTAREALEIQIWWNNQMVHSVAYPLKEFPRVHF